MAYDSRVYRILIASPSDVEEEREIAVSVIQQWNDLHSHTRKIVLLPLRWETHTAPDYGTRPQEVINRAIVDECDMLVGVFWTRIGSATGVSESGTLEEIERVGKAAKPIMLYFSKLGIDPDKIDTAQIDRLKQFKENTYPKGLVEHYKTHIEFRDKFSKQLELKVRELQLGDAKGEAPLTLTFLSIRDGESGGNTLQHRFQHPQVTGLEEVPENKREKVNGLIARIIRQKSYLPLALVIENSSPSGIRNLFVELDISASSTQVEISDSLGGTRLFIHNYLFTEETTSDLKPMLDKYDADKLQVLNNGWRLAFEWEALQPQRTRLIKPILQVYSPETCELTIKAKVYADSFPKPFTWEGKVFIDAEQKYVPLKELAPNWEEILARESKVFHAGNAVFSTIS